MERRRKPSHAQEWFLLANGIEKKAAKEKATGWNCQLNLMIPHPAGLLPASVRIISGIHFQKKACSSGFFQQRVDIIELFLDTDIAFLDTVLHLVEIHHLEVSQAWLNEDIRLIDRQVGSRDALLHDTD